jgi:hypothetical protein
MEAVYVDTILDTLKLLSGTDLHQKDIRSWYKSHRVVPNLSEQKDALRATAVPLPGKNILHKKVQNVNPYSGKGMTFWTSFCLTLVPGELRYFQRLSC